MQGKGEIDLFKPINPPPAPSCQPLKLAFNLRVPAGPCESDIARNGVVDAGDLLSVLAAWGPCACELNCPANVDAVLGSTAVDVKDLLKIINTWGGCP